MATVSNLNTTTTTAATSKSAGLSAMSGSDFIKVMLAQLQHQDPLNPQDSGQMLTQMSQIKSLETNQTLSDSITASTLQTSIASGASLIGKSVAGIDDSGTAVTGSVKSAIIQNQKVYLQLDSGSTLPITSVTNITPATTPAASSLSTLNSLLNSLQNPATTTTPIPAPATTTTTPTPTATTTG